jgi:hypothetical protein
LLLQPPLFGDIAQHTDAVSLITIEYSCRASAATAVGKAQREHCFGNDVLG